MRVPLFRRIEEIEREEGPRAAAISDELTVDGWHPLLHVQANTDPAITEHPARSFNESAQRMDDYYRAYWGLG